MKIALVSPYDFPYPGGVTEHIIGLAGAARRRGHTVHILAASSGYRGVSLPDTRIVTRKIVTVSVGGARARIGLLPWGYRTSKKILQSEQYDVIHLHEPLAPGVTWLMLYHLRSQPRAITVGTFHAFHERPYRFYRYSRAIAEKILARLDGRIAVSQAAWEYVSRFFPGNYHIIPNGIDLERFGKKNQAEFDQNRSILQNTITILFVGRLDRRKGFNNLLEAFIKLKPRYPTLRLQAVGPFEPAQVQPYQKIAQAHGIVNDLEFTGYVSPEELPGIYHNADVFCAPSIGSESFGIVLLEAMAAGLPIVASDIAGYRSVISNGREGLLATPGQPAALVAALSRLIDNPALRRLMAQQGQARARQYSWDYIIDNILMVYQNLIQHKQKIQSVYLSQINPDDTRTNSAPARRITHV